MAAATQGEQSPDPLNACTCLHASSFWCPLFAVQAERRARCGEGVYVSVIGNVKRWQDKLSIQVFDMRPITDMNEVSAMLNKL